MGKRSVRSPDRDMMVAKMREQYKWTFVQIGQQLGITTSRARQLYVRIVRDRHHAKLAIELTLAAERRW